MRQVRVFRKRWRTRDAILSQALQIVSAEGLNGLTIGRLAKDMSMSKSGLFAHFLSKEALELATVERAREVFADKVLVPAEGESEGLGALWNLCDRWLKHIEERVFKSGYFFTGAFFECARQRGHVSQRLTQVGKEWFAALKTRARQAKEHGEVRSNENPARIAMELNGVLLGAYWAHLTGDWFALDTARVAVLAKFRAVATSKIPAEAFESVSAFRKYLRKSHNKLRRNPSGRC